MKAYNAKITSENIKNHFEKSGLTIEVFANILEVSKRWLEYILAGEKNYEFAPNTIQKACDFFIADFRKFTTELQTVPKDFREFLKMKHSRNSEYNKILLDAPSVPFIIDEILIKDDEFISSTGLELKFVKQILWRYYPDLKLTNLSSDLQKSDSIYHSLHPTKKKKTNIYRTK
ncbi:hypothetical protein KO02_01410 [Sphingobacterium sp. ML3W]|uniref:hypothetical protein n=1 Tax=Sphingobacterium sp. ML3W TaxID=1538644 RepID=UPI0004F6734A|nr:hypothetical protein [Sphingobacterium sp. ML3W]AIM35466.1 hypothetical protein KO02_01410 [Sphingobacterium sp. ML3W]